MDELAEMFYSHQYTLNWDRYAESNISDVEPEPDNEDIPEE